MYYVRTHTGHFYSFRSRWNYDTFTGMLTRNALGFDAWEEPINDNTEDED